jgi:DHA3 family tetracycline resistance protein-like MFS transporter
VKKFDTYKVYLFIETASSLLYSLAFTAMSLYEIHVAKLSPLQLVLVGTTLELTVLLCEVPTGIVADVYSRRLSIIIGFCLIGAGFLLEGLVPLFATILLAQVLWGLGYTFTSGATQAWLSDEIGEERANQAFLRANKFSLAGSLAGMLFAISIGSRQVNLPILASGGLFMLLAAILSLAMLETGFHPASLEKRNSFQQMLQTLRLGLSTVRQRPRLLTILGVGLFYGLYSEGFDRLWVKHLLSRFPLPALFGSSDIAFFGLLRAASMLFSILATALVERRLDASQPSSIARLMTGITAGIAASLVFFAWSPWLTLALGFYLLITALRNLVGPLTNAWVNQRLDSDVRATILSMTGQVDAVGQIAGGPLIGLVASFFSVPAAIAASGLLLTPALSLIGAAGRKMPRE